MSGNAHHSALLHVKQQLVASLVRTCGGSRHHHCLFYLFSCHEKFDREIVSECYRIIIKDYILLVNLMTLSTVWTVSMALIAIRCLLDIDY